MAAARAEAVGRLRRLRAAWRDFPCRATPSRVSEESPTTPVRGDERHARPDQLADPIGFGVELRHRRRRRRARQQLAGQTRLRRQRLLDLGVGPRRRAANNTPATASAMAADVAAEKSFV